MISYEGELSDKKLTYTRDRDTFHYYFFPFYLLPVSPSLGFPLVNPKHSDAFTTQVGKSKTYLKPSGRKGEKGSGVADESFRYTA